MDRIAARIVKADPAFREVVDIVGPPEWRPPADDAFAALIRAIVFQQLAGKAASAIHGRLVALFDGAAPTPQALLALSQDQLRAAGLSGSKQRALLDLAAKFHDGTVPVHDVEELSDDEVVERLVQVRGIGRWTAEMFLMFQLRRPDVWPIDDYGVRNGWARIHGLQELPSPKALKAEGDRFRPHRSTAAWYCWRAVTTITPG